MKKNDNIHYTSTVNKKTITMNTILS